MKSNAFVLMLDASKAFDRVNYCKLFRELLKREMSPLVLRLLLYMYTNQTLRVKWGSVMSESFTVMNGVKQGGVLSPILFAVYTDGLLLRLQESGIGCHMGGHYAGATAYADDITLISPSMTGLRKMSSIREQYASEYDILFNGSKSKLLFFKGRCCNVSTLGLWLCIISRCQIMDKSPCNTFLAMVMIKTIVFISVALNMSTVSVLNYLISL